ncbi:hypothetical protein, partial [Pseudomonas viridiflava]|uniref:hypothetical protein n=1 Tax=Pseudomonas viridiflava TaxID=33069 RepID=UPI0019D6AD51
TKSALLGGNEKGDPRGSPFFRFPAQSAQSNNPHIQRVTAKKAIDTHLNIRRMPTHSRHVAQLVRAPP